MPLRYSPPWRGGGYFMSCFLTCFNIEKRAPGNLTFLAPSDIHSLLDEAVLLLSSKAHLHIFAMKTPSSFLSSGLSSAAVPFLSWIFNLSHGPQSYASPYLREVHYNFLPFKLTSSSPSLPDFQKEWRGLIFAASSCPSHSWTLCHKFLSHPLYRLHSLKLRMAA